MSPDLTSSEASDAPATPSTKMPPPTRAEVDGPLEVHAGDLGLVVQPASRRRRTNTTNQPPLHRLGAPRRSLGRATATASGSWAYARQIDKVDTDSAWRSGSPIASSHRSDRRKRSTAASRRPEREVLDAEGADHLEAIADAHRSAVRSARSIRRRIALRSLRFHAAIAATA